MGTWGVDIFEDDLALDIKDMFEELIENGQSVQSAAAAILNEFEDSLEDFDEGAVVVLVLGTLCEKQGEIIEGLKSELIRVVDDTEYWDYLKDEDEELYTSRRQSLSRLLDAYK